MTYLFTEAVRQVVREIPAGQIMTYKQVAQKAGKPKAARAVGMIMSKNYDSTVPCHRVIKSDGTVANYNRGGEMKKKLMLEQEGITFKDETKVCEWQYAEPKSLKV